jgi:hypothetical protein
MTAKRRLFLDGIIKLAPTANPTNIEFKEDKINNPLN